MTLLHATSACMDRTPVSPRQLPLGEEQIAANSVLLAERAVTLVAGEYGDPLDDLRRFVRYAWPETPLISGACGQQFTKLGLTNPGRASRYLSSLSIELDGSKVDPEQIVLVNNSVGESGTTVSATMLDEEHGFYVRREQTAEILMSGVEVEPGRHRVRAEIGLGGVTDLVLDELVEFAPI